MRLLPVALLAALAPVPLAQIGSVVRTLRISDFAGGFGDLHVNDFFGGAVAALGDLNNDRIGDLAVGASGDDDGGATRGAVWILLLNADGSVQSRHKISQTQGGFTGTLSDVGIFGRRLAAVGDLDGDGLTELATTSRNPNQLWILFLAADGSLKKQTSISYSDPLFVPPTQASYFESIINGVIRVGGLAALGDLDGDRLGDLAVGAPGDPDGSGSGAVWILHLSSSGTLRAVQKISQTQGGFGGTLHNNAAFGSSLALLGDLDADGHPELGVGSRGEGQFWRVELDANGRVLDQQAFGGNDYGLHLPGQQAYLTDDTYAALGDLDGDGVSEVAMGFELHDFPGRLRDEGGFALGFLRTDGSVRKRLAVSDHLGGLGDLTASGRFGGSFAPLGDLDGDGTPELAVGAPQERGPGAVWILSLAPSALRNGSGVNPQSLSQASEPVFGTPWALSLDCSGHASGAAIVWGYSRPNPGVLSPFGEVLVGGSFFFQRSAAHLSGPTPLTLAVPPLSLALLDLPLHVQGLCTGAPGPQLSNALDVLLGQ